MMHQFDNKTVLITGALGTIGQALVTGFAREGATVIAADRPDMPDAQKTLDGMAAGVRYFGCDLNDLAATEKAVTALAEEVGGIDILVNNAAFVVNKGYEEFSIEEYEKEVRINSSAAFIVARACAVAMKAKKYGRIINLTSATLSGHWEGFAPYIASKGASYGLVKALSRELGHHGITVNGISPGAVLSDAEGRHFAERAQAYHDWILERQCLKRRIEPEAIADLAVFLASSKADMITAQNISCDGGW